MNKNKKREILLSITSTFLLAPLFVYAYAFDPGSVPATVNFSIVSLIGIVFDILWPVAIAFFIIMFIVASFKYVTAQGDPGKVAEANKFVIWGMAGVAVALLAWSIPLFVRNRLGV